MDEVQRFIANNQHQFGYIMQEASRQWVAKDPVGALTVGDCNIVVEKHGQYHELLEKAEKLEKDLATVQEYWMQERDLAARQKEHLRQENERLIRALDRIGFYCAGTELNHVSEFVLRVKRGEQP